MRDLGLLRSTAGGKAGAIDGLNLFFGALLGANLGTTQGMALRDYTTLIFLLAGTVMVIRMLSTSKRRVYMLINVAVYALLISAILFVPVLQPKGVATDDLHRLGVTLGIWIAFALITELMPVSEDSIV
jgi:hypothetical protein